MNIVGKLFDVTDLSKLSSKLGNILISGIETSGREVAFYDLLKTSLSLNKTTIVIQDDMNSERLDKLMSEAGSFLSGKKVFNCRLSHDGMFDVLSFFERSEDKANFIVYLISSNSDIPETLKAKIYRFYYYAFDALDRLSKSYTLRDVVKFDIEYVCELIDESSMDESEKNRRLRFLKDSTTYSSFLDMETYLFSLESSEISELYSGHYRAEDVFATGNLIIVSGLIGDNRQHRELLINSFTFVLNILLDKLCSANAYTIFFRNTDYIKNELLKTFFECNGVHDCATYIVMEDVSRYISNSGNDLLDIIKTFLVFSQGSSANAEFWSEFFGSRDFQERSFSYTKKKSLNPFANMWDRGGVIDTPKKYNTATTNIQKVNKPIYRPEIFRELKVDEVMCYSRDPLIRRKGKLEI